MAGRQIGWIGGIGGIGGVMRGSRIGVDMEANKIGSKDRVQITEIIVKIVSGIQGNRINTNKRKKDVWYICMVLGHIVWKEQLFYLLW